MAKIFLGEARILVAVAAVLWLAGCSAPNPLPAPDSLVQCEAPRPELCTQDYRPVCGTREIGAGGSTELRTYGNACSACSNPDVIGFVEGPCED